MEFPDRGSQTRCARCAGADYVKPLTEAGLTVVEELARPVE
jgi:hypothetical protein